MFFLISVYLSFDRDMLLFWLTTGGMAVYALLIIGVSFFRLKGEKKKPHNQMWSWRQEFRFTSINLDGWYLERLLSDRVRKAISRVSFADRCSWVFRLFLRSKSNCTWWLDFFHAVVVSVGVTRRLLCRCIGEFLVSLCNTNLVTTSKYEENL